MPYKADAYGLSRLLTVSQNRCYGFVLLGCVVSKLLTKSQLRDDELVGAEIGYPLEQQGGDIDDGERTQFSWATDDPPLPARYRLEWRFNNATHTS